jgi:NAD(P)-dependent dehydrogenase (short-subunit alcohol dehydrogenase family)
MSSTPMTVADDAPLVALITAGTAGLGAATAQLFARNGLRVVVNFNSDADRAAELVRLLHRLSPLSAGGGEGSNFLALKADLGKRDDMEDLVRQVVAAMGRLDVVFSNGGWTRPRDIADLDDNLVEADWDACFNMNVTTASLAGVKVSGSSLVSIPAGGRSSICQATYSRV